MHGSKPGHGRPTAGSPAHKANIKRLIAAGCSVRRFRRRARDIIGLPDSLPKFIPDAYQIVDDAKRVVLYEVVVTHDLQPSKVTKLSAWRDALVERGWSLRVFVVDPLGYACEVEPDTGRPTQAERDAATDRVARALTREASP